VFGGPNVAKALRATIAEQNAREARSDLARATTRSGARA
jgi:hypothetical protein